jgi:L-lactate dehydrogenase complex protein LldG
MMRAEAVQMQVTVVDDTSDAGKVIREFALSASPEWGNERRIVAWRHSLIDALDLEALLEKDDISVAVTRSVGEPDTEGERLRLRKDIEAAYIGITSADYLVAHTATMVMKSRPRQLRSVSLVPSIHVCVVLQDQLVADLEELYTRLQWEPGRQGGELTNCMTFISAPSKTGDIELVMVNGARGPREVHIIVIRE